jgi:hypothetical protein
MSALWQTEPATPRLDVMRRFEVIIIVQSKVEITHLVSVGAVIVDRIVCAERNTTIGPGGLKLWSAAWCKVVNPLFSAC